MQMKGLLYDVDGLERNDDLQYVEGRVASFQSSKLWTSTYVPTLQQT